MSDGHGLPPLATVAAALAGTDGAFLSHGSALALHGLLAAPAPPGVVTATAPVPGRARALAGVSLRFVRCRPADLFGVVTRVVPGGPGLRLSDAERTVVDGLRRPELCGGLPAVAGALWGGRDALDPERLAAYALRAPGSTVARRLGFLLELLALPPPPSLARLRERSAGSWAALDPVRPAAGRHCAPWHLSLNVPPQEVAAACGLDGLPGLAALGLGGTTTGRQIALLWRSAAAASASSSAASPVPATRATPSAPAAPAVATRDTGAGAPVAPCVAVQRPRRLAGLCRRYDLLRAVALEGAFADLAGHVRRDAQGCLPPLCLQARSSAGSLGGPVSGEEAVPILVELHTDRDLGPAELRHIEKEMTEILGRTVTVRTMRDLLHRLSRLAWHGGTVVYHRHDRGQ